MRSDPGAQRLLQQLRAWREAEDWKPTISELIARLDRLARAGDAAIADKAEIAAIKGRLRELDAEYDAADQRIKALEAERDRLLAEKLSLDGKVN
jgi:predicted RNase H-like nuclease (RuvC/YqgF family)